MDQSTSEFISVGILAGMAVWGFGCHWACDACAELASPLPTVRQKGRIFVMMLLLPLLAIDRGTSQTPGIPPIAVTPTAASAPTIVPALVPYAGVALSTDGKPLAGDATATFLLFKDERGGEPLWIESQTITVGPTGNYQVKLGATSANGLPLDTFASGEVRWLEVQIAGQSVGPRVLLTSVPYALKAADAATLGGLPASAFVLAGALAVTSVGPDGITANAATNVTTTGGTNLYLPRFSGASTVINSEIYDTGTSVGIGNIPNAGAKLDVNGPMIMRGSMTVSRTGNATSSKAYPSYGFDFFSNVYNSSTKASDNPYFQLQSEPTGNNTALPSATFNLLFANNGGAIAETGFYINPNGTIHFASGQTFPGGTGTGTITGVTAGTGLSGGGTSGNVTLSVNTATVPTLSGSNTFTGSNTFGPSIYENTDVNIDNTNSNPGNISPGLRFGSASGEGMSSQRTSGGNNQYGLDFYTDYMPRLSIGAAGNVGIGSYPSTAIGLNVSTSADFGITVDNTSPSPTIDAFNQYNQGFAIVFQAENESTSCRIDNSANLQCDGTISGSQKDFKIDHPLDPANKYLVHSSVESSEMLNIYSGNVTTDGSGTATVNLPDWFAAENGDFRYQLTTIGRDAHAWISQEVSNGLFKISTNETNVKVSWQITAVRQDGYAKAHPLVVEQQKQADERGLYQHPEFFGQPKETGITYTRRLKFKSRMQARPAATAQTATNVSTAP